MRVIWLLLLATLIGCAGPQVRQAYQGPAQPSADVATVYPSSAKGALVLITAVDGKNAYETMYGYAGPVSVLPGEHIFDAQITIGIDAPGTTPAEMVPPPGVKPVELVATDRSLMVDRYRASVKGPVAAGKEYEVRYGYVIDSGRKQHVLWLEPRRQQDSRGK